MRKSVIAAAVAALVLIVVLILSLTGAVVPSIEGSAQPNEPTRVLKDLNASATALADAPGAKYNGALTLTSSSGSLDIKVTDLTVTAAGDVRGKIKRGSDPIIQWMQIGAKTFVKGNEAFWSKQDTKKQPSGVKLDNASSDKWVSVPEEFLGIDLRAALRPSRLGLNVSQQDTQLGTAEVQGDSVGLIGETPDRRADTGADPIGVSELDVEENDGGLAGDRRFQAGSLTAGVNDGGDIVALRGPIGKGFGGDLVKVESNLSVEKLDQDTVRSVYSDFSKNLKGAKIGATDVTIGEPDGDLTCDRGADCVIGYTVTNTASGLDGGTVTVRMETTFEKGGKEFNSCSTSTTMPINGRGTVTCRVPFGAPADVNSLSRFTVVVDGTLDDAALTTSVDQGRKVAETATGWVPSAPKALAAARDYNRQVAVAPSDYVYKVGEFAFDGRERDGTLLLVHGPGYESHVQPDGTLDPAWKGTEQLLTQAKDARSAAGEQPVRMVFAESRTADAVRKLLIDNGVERVEVVAVTA